MKKVLIFDEEKLLNLNFSLNIKANQKEIYKKLEELLLQSNQDILIKITDKKENSGDRNKKGYIYLIGEELPLALDKDNTLFFIFREIPLLTFSDTLEILKRKFDIDKELFLVLLQKKKKQEVIEYFLKASKSIDIFNADNLNIQVSELLPLSNKPLEIKNETLNVNTENLKETSTFSGGIIDLTSLLDRGRIKINIDGEKADFTYVPFLYNLLKGILWLKEKVYTEFVIKDSKENPKLYFNYLSNTPEDFWNEIMYSLKLISLIQNKNFDYRIDDNKQQVVVEGRIY